MAEPIRVLIVASHPVQYASPQFRCYASDPRIDLSVAYCSLEGASAMKDRDFGRIVEWDVPLLEGYRWRAVANRSPSLSARGAARLINLGLWSIIVRGRFDVVVSYLGYRSISAWIAWVAAKVSKTPLVLTTDAHTVEPLDERGWKAPVKRAILPWIFRSASGVFAPSTRTRRYLESLGIDPASVFMTPYVVDNGFFAGRADEVDRDAVRDGWSVGTPDTVCLFVGKLVPWKRPGDLIEALAAVDGAVAVFAGDGELRPSLERLAKELGVDERVRFLGFVNQTELPSVYVGADVLVLPSSYEAFGVVVNEMFACGGTAIVSDACGAVGDLVIDGETGLVVPVGNIAALGDALETMTDIEHRRRMAAAAEVQLAGWDLDANAEAFVDACDRLSRR